MAWVRIDDHFDEHPKMQRVGPLAWGFWLAGLAYCNRNLTDGFIPWNKARTLCSFQVQEDDGRLWELSRSSGMVGDDVTADWLIGLLIDSGLWDEISSESGRVEGYRIHDYQQYQPLKAQIEEERAKKVAAGQAGGKASAQARAQAPAQAKSKQSSTPNPNPNPNPNPTPDLGEESPKPSLRAREKTTGGFDSFYATYPRKTGRADAEKAWKKLNPSPELQAEIMAAVARQQLWESWQSGYIPHPATFLNGRRWEDEEPPPKSNGKAKPGLFSGFEEFDRMTNGTTRQDEADNVIEPEWSVR